MTTSSGTALVTLPTDTQILITRWWGGQRGQVTLVEVDLRVGGRWRYVMTANGGFEVAFHGEYREIDPGTRLVTKPFTVIQLESELEAALSEPA